MGSIDRILGNEDIPDSLDWDGQIRFTHVSELIEAMLQRSMCQEVIQAAERCFEYVENLSVVIDPDTFAADCYEPIIRAWISALHGSKVKAADIAERVQSLGEADDYGVFLISLRAVF